jgi:succinate dehydrogenase / fumarate reductase iron-sulfur subunit
MPNHIHLRIKRQSAPKTASYWEDFKLPYRPRQNIISCLMEIRRYPVSASGKKTTAVVWECNCLEEVCGSCTMIINGKPRQACSALVDKLKQPITLEPLSKFPVFRDLMVDRQIMFDNLRRVKAWISVDGTYGIGPGPRVVESTRLWAYELSRCMTCGCCMQACPQVNSRSTFIGPAAIAQVRLMNTHPTGALQADERLEALIKAGGASECGNAQNCQKACPKNIPLLTSIADINRQITVRSLLGWLKK